MFLLDFHCELGQPFYEEDMEIFPEIFYITATHKDGQRFCAYMGRANNPNQFQRLKAKCEGICQRSPVINKIDPDFWHQIDPVYGSEAYQITGQESQNRYQEFLNGDWEQPF